jgi:hypothetical protein
MTNKIRVSLLPPTDAQKTTIKVMEDRASEYRSQVGFVATSWNVLQESLGALFASVLSNIHVHVALAIWYSEPNDRAQRRLLRAAINAGALDHTKQASKLPPHAKDDLLWLLESADTLGSRRDQALHAPVTFDLSDAENLSMMAAYFQGNPLAAQLRGKDLIQEFSLSIRRANMFTLYIRKICGALEEQAIPWPDKPPPQSRKTLRRSKE